MAAVTQLSIPPLIKTTAFVLLEFGSIFVEWRWGPSRAWILMGLEKKSQRVRRLAHSRPRCICAAAAEAAPEGHHRESSAPGSQRAVRHVKGKRGQDSACYEVCRSKCSLTNRSRRAMRSRT